MKATDYCDQFHAAPWRPELFQCLALSRPRRFDVIRHFLSSLWTQPHTSASPNWTKEETKQPDE